MIEGMPWPAQVGAASLGWVLTAVYTLAVIRGRLAPRNAIDDVIHDRDEWRAESRIKDAQIAEKDTQLRYMSEVGEMQKMVLSAVQRLNDEEPAP